jgi:hypothetical protein
MMRRYPLLCAAFTLISIASLVNGQTATPTATVPTMVKFSGTVQGMPSRIIGMTFALYKEQQGGPALWLETQSVSLNASGHYSVQLGATLPNGLPMELFTSGEARWLGVQAEGQAEQPRVLLLSVPYALKAADAETIGGLPPSAFVLATPGAAPSAAAAVSPSTSADSSAPPANPAVTGVGTVSFIPLWDTTSDIVNSVLFQSGSGAAAKVGINTTTPSTTLDVKGTGTIRGSLTMPATGIATATAGKNSQPVNQVASSFNSSTHAAVNETFRWQSEPAANNTANPSATLNLLFGAGAASPTETGLKISNTGIFTFADSQTFPGTGTITGLTAGAGMTGGGNSGNVTLGLTNTCSNSQVLQWNGTTWVCTTISSGGTITGVTAGTDLSGGGTTGNVTLNLDTAKVPQLNTANTFTGNQTVNGNMSATGLVTGSAYNIGSDLFAFGSSANRSAFLGFAGSGAANYSDTAVGWRALYSDAGSSNTAIGAQALLSNTTGYQNAAGGAQALNSNTTGYNNTASGASTLFYNTTGYNNTASGEGALFYNTAGNFNTASGIIALASNTTGNNNTASGAQALNSNTTGLNNTATGTAALVLNSTGSDNTASGYEALWSNTTGFNNTASGEYALFYNTTGSSNTALGYFAGPDSNHANLTNATAIGALSQVTASNALVLGSINGVNGATADTLVGIGTTAPTAKLDVHGTANFTGLITFAAGQTFPGAGTITGVTPGTALTGGGSSGSVTLSVDTTKVVTGVTAGTDLTGGGTGGVQTLNLDTTKVPQLNAANSFTASQSVTGNVTATGTVTGGVVTASTSFNLGGNTFAFGSAPSTNVFLGYAGNFTTTGTGNTASGWQALLSDTLGTWNTANGDEALKFNTAGNSNTAVGTSALQDNTTGTSNTAVGFGALVYTNGSFNTGLGYDAGEDQNYFNLTNSTAIGAHSDVTESNALVLGSINGVNGATADTNVGIGTTAPSSTLDVEATAAAGSGPILLLENKAAIASGTTGNAIDLRFAPDGGSNVVNPNAYIRVQEDGNSQYGAFMSFATMADGGAGSGALERMRIAASGNIGIGTASPDALLSVNGSADKAGGGSWGTFSDARLKNLNGDFSSGLTEILKLHPIRYHYKEENAMGIRDHDEHIGFVAQDVQKVIPEAVTENSRGYLLVNNDPILWAMLNAIHEQQRQIQEQRQQIRLQQRQIARLSSKVGVLETALRTPKRAKANTAQPPSPARRQTIETESKFLASK